jgi:hypothetical protein
MTLPPEFYGTVTGLWQVYQPVVFIWLVLVVAMSGIVATFWLLYPVVTLLFKRPS